MNLMWMQSGGCGGCSISLLGRDTPDLMTYLEDFGIDILWHPCLSDVNGGDLLDILDRIMADEIQIDIFVFEGAVLRGPNRTGEFHMLSGTDTSMMEWAKRLAEKSRYTVAVGNCAAFGGMTSAGCNPTDACGLQYEGKLFGGLLGSEYRSKENLPVINVAGCPIHPEWMTDLLSLIANKELSESDLDTFNRPRFYTDTLVHHGCSRNEYYEYKASAEKPSDLGCLMENLGCMATQAQGDCNTRRWHQEGSCINGGFACINCTSPEFEEPGYPLTQTPKIAGIPIGLPTDMPKAWFVALTSLSKAATPGRVKKNAVSDTIVVAPGITKKK